MNLLLIVLPVLAFILFGFIVAVIIPIEIFTVKSDHIIRELSFAVLTLLILPILIITLLIKYQLYHNSNSDFHNIVRVGGILNSYLYTVTPGFLITGVLVKIIRKEGYRLLFWGSLFLAFTLPVILLFFGVPICEFFVNIFWNEDITVRNIMLH